MKVVIKKDLEALSRYGAAKLIAAMMQPGRVNIGPTAGSTPKRMYEIVAEFLQGNEGLLENNDIHYYLQDNLVSTKRPAETDIFSEINEMFFEANKIPESRIYRQAIADMPTLHEKIEAEGGLDLSMLGLGADGHFAANMPGTPFGNKGYCDVYTGDIQVNMAAHYGVPDADAWTTLGPATLMQAKEIVMLAAGSGKADIVKAVVEGPITEDIPASVLRLHPNMTLVIDEAAAAKLANK